MYERRDIFQITNFGIYVKFPELTIPVNLYTLEFISWVYNNYTKRRPLN